MVYVLEDESVIVKKENGESVILNPDDSVLVLDKEGKVNSKDDFRFKVHYNLKSKIKQMTATD